MSSFLGEIKHGDYVYDIGGNIGIFSIHAAKYGENVISFEPDPEFRARLVKNTELNGLQRSIEIMDWAVSNSKGKVTLYTNGASGSSPSLVKVGERGAVTVKTDSIDNVIDEGLISAPDLIKIDIEGAEILALKGM